MKVAKDVAHDRPREGDEEEEEDVEALGNAAVDVETTSYALLWLLSGEIVDETVVVETAAWLNKQMRSEGGFYSTQDTIVGKISSC